MSNIQSLLNFSLMMLIALIILIYMCVSCTKTPDTGSPATVHTVVLTKK